MIIKTSKTDLSRSPYQNILFPDQFKTRRQKENPEWIKTNMDYYANCAYAQFVRNSDTFVKNYDLCNGILGPQDFYEDVEVRSFTDTLLKDVELPRYVQHYSLFNGPLNDAVGELCKRPDSHRIKAFDDDSRSEEMEFRTQLLNKFLYQEIRNQIRAKAAAQGQQIPPDEEEQITLEQVKEQMLDYTSAVEGWANHVLEACKVAFNMKEQSEEGFRDLFICGREYFLPIEDNSKLGFSMKNINPKNAWFHTTADKKWTRDAFFGGTIDVNEISQIIEEVPELTTEEIDHMRENYSSYGLIDVADSNYGRNVSGIESINYNTYSPAQVEMRLRAEAEMVASNNDGLGSIFGLASNVGAFGNKYVVVRAYWISKKIVKQVTFTDEKGFEQSMLVDESYKSGDMPTEISVEQGWINCWYQGIKVGPDIYHVREFKLMDRFPLIGVQHNIKNSEVRAPIDYLKPFQAIFNLCLNQLWELLGKEKGQVLKIQLKRIPHPKDSDSQDSIEQWEQDALSRGIVFEDDSPDNLRTSIPNTNTTQVLDWTLSKQIQSRYTLAITIKDLAYELIGFSRQRLASVQATETATATNTAIAQSYAQTEPLFATHDYLMNQVNQAIIDCARYTQSKKETSTISYITRMGESAAIEMTGEELSFRDLWVFDTSRPEDIQMYNELRMLAQPYMQNGGDMSEVVELYTNQSIRALKKIYRDFKAQRDQMQQQQTELQQKQIDNQKEIAQQQMQLAAQQKEQQRADDNYNKEQDRRTKVEVAVIQALGFAKDTGADFNSDKVPDIYQGQELIQRSDEMLKTHDLALQKLALERDKLNYDNINKEKDRQVDLKNQDNDLAISKQNAKGRAKKKK